MMLISRRRFLRNVSLSGGGLVLGINLSGCAGEVEWPNRNPAVFQPNAFLQILPQGGIILTVHKAEMGQGVMTGFATLVAEELEIDPMQLQFAFAEPHDAYVNDEFPLMITGGSSSLSGNFTGLRVAAATARMMLQSAAAEQWQVPVDSCIAGEGTIRTRDGSHSLSYAALADAAALQPVPESVPLKDPSAWRVIGRYDTRVDALPKVNGSAEFSLDVSLPGMLTGVLVRCPHFSGKLLSFDASRALEREGVRKIFELNRAVALVADNYWQARNAAHDLDIEWEPGPVADHDSASILAEQRRLLDVEQGRVVHESGTAETDYATVVEAEYQVPYVAHAAMEPLNAVARVTKDSAEIWAGNQAPDMLRNLAARMLGMSRDQVTVHSTYMGGAFGRRGTLDYALEAVALAREVGVPVKLVWSREDDMRHDYYRPAVMSRLRAGITETGELHSWSQRVVAPSIMAEMIPSLGASMLPAWIPAGVLKPVAAMMRARDPMAVEGAKELPYQLPHLRVEFLHWDPGVPISVWRSVGHSQNAFFTECFADEVAHAMKEDPLAFRLSRLAPDSRMRKVLELVAGKSDWNEPVAGLYRGLAAHESFNTFVAEVAEVSIDDNGGIRVHRVICAVDCGLVVNPDVVRSQVESGVVYGLSAALYGQITLAAGAVQQGNFDDYPVMRMGECPEIEVYMVESQTDPSGIGEPGLPPVAPAVANAVFAATGKRLRSLPLKLS